MINRGDLIELRTGKGFSCIYHDDGFHTKTLWESEDNVMLIIDVEQWDSHEFFKIIHPEAGVCYIRANQVQKVGEPNPWPRSESGDY